MVPNALSCYRGAQRLRAFAGPLLPRALIALGAWLHTTYIDLAARLDEGVELGYGGLGVVIAPGVRVGEGSFIAQEVTLGEAPGRPGVPRLGRDVLVGAGAKVLGPVVVGDHAEIGANAVVLEDVAPGAVVAGVPARELRRKALPASPREPGSPGGLRPPEE